MDQVEYREIIKLVCPHCRADMPSTFRPATREWVHVRSGTSHMSTICWAHGFRTSRFNDHYEEGYPTGGG
jgi:hypothetical protein